MGTALLVMTMALFAAPAETPEVISVCGSRIEVIFDGPALDLPRAQVLDWVRKSARAVSTYFGRFPVARYRLALLVGEGSGVQGGTTWGWGGAHTELRVGRHLTVAQLAGDWVMTHEMIHVAFPDPGDAHPWVTEGVATYVEPLARSFIGGYPPRKVWSDLVEGLPNGLPGRGDPGLDGISSWASNYWGGALFFTYADVEIRRRTHNRRGLIDALRAILAAGGTDEVEWSEAKIFATGDGAVGVPVLTELWKERGPKPVAPDLDRLWRALGVPRDAEAPFDDGAAEAAIRQAILAAPPAACP